MVTEIPATQRISTLIGRHNEKQRIAQAIQGQGPPILFLEGDAGIGKTMLLEEAAAIATAQGAICPPIIDFYDTEMHAHRTLEATVALSLDPDREAFRDYWTGREQWATRGETLREQQQELWGRFLKGYTQATRGKRVVLRFDTVERLEYERDSEEVLADCEVSPQDAPSWEWLLSRIGELPDTTVLIAARPTSAGLLKQRLREAHGAHGFFLEVSGFSLVETQAYFEATEVGREVASASPEMVGKVHLLTEGRPILIALALDWLARGMWEAHIYPASLEQLQGWQAAAQQEEAGGRRGEAWQRWDEIKRSFEVALVQRIRNLDHGGLDVATKYAALARKGCNAELLARLMGVSQEVAQELVEQLLGLSFVKPPRTPRQLFFLHDEMYDLVEKHIWQVDWPDYLEQARLDQIIIEWHTGQIEALKERIRACADWRERMALRREQHLLQAERLYYQFDADPRLGYREYSHLDEEAIMSREHEWDTWLHNEALWFISHRAWRRGKENGAGPEDYPRRDPARVKDGRAEHNPAVDYDCRRRWINRYIARNEMARAARIAEKLLDKSRQNPHPEQPELYPGGLQIALATAQAYIGGELVEPALRNLDEGLQALMSVPDEHKEPWLYPHLLGTAYLYKGLALRGLLRLSEAARAYSQASQYYQGINYLPGLAEAMNNLAYVYARQGQLEPARAACDKALSIRQELGDEYGIGLSLNTRGIIHERLDRPLAAIRNSQQALDLFKEINDERGIILAEINLGRAYRRKARSPEWGQQDADFERGRDYLEDAIHRQGQLGASADVFYRIEAHNELGCLYRDWAATPPEKGTQDEIRMSGLLERAESHLNQALDLAAEEGKERHPVQYVDSLEDLARVYYWRHKSGLATGAWAERSGIHRPLEAMQRLLDEAQKLTQEHLKEWDELGFILGKIHYQRARLARAKAEPGETAQLASVAESYARAAAFLEDYSFDAPELRKTVSDACDWLSTLPPKEAQAHIQHMAAMLKAEGQDSKRLKEWVNSVVYPLLGVGWPQEEQEAAHG